MKALALFSGWLDSVLSILAIKKQWIEVVGVTMTSLFGCKSIEEIEEKNKKIAQRFWFEMIACEFSEEQFEIIKNPKFGHGKNLNPCLDCHILMLKKAKKIMEEIWASFIITWEVIWQRPKSQRRDTFPVIDREVELEWLIVRPLSAKLLPLTIPEKEWWIDRERLYKIWWRWRKEQIKIAQENSWDDYPTPAGWCLLTDIWYSKRLLNIIKDKSIIPPEIDIKLLTIWRHFNIWETHIIVGKKKEDNEMIFALAWENDYIMQVMNYGSPLTIIRWVYNQDNEEIIAWITARYSDGKNENSVKVRVFNKKWNEKILSIKPLSQEETKQYIIE